MRTSRVSRYSFVLAEIRLDADVRPGSEVAKPVAFDPSMKSH
jgi:hypothetical protein